MAYNPNNANGNATTANSAPVTIAADSTTGTLTALNSTVSCITTGAGSLNVQLSGTWVGTVTFEGSNDNFATTQAITSVYLGGIATQASSQTINGFFSVLPQGFNKVQCRMSAYTSGTATVAMFANVSTRVTVPLQGNAANLLMTATQGPAGAAAWKVDGSAVTQPVSGTVTANAGTGTMAVSAASLPLPSGASTSALQSSVQGTVAAGTAATNSSLGGGVFNTALPTLTNGQQAAVQLDSSGRQIIAQATASALNMTDATGALAQGTVAAGTAATKSVLIGGQFNTVLPTLTNTQQAAAQLDSSSRLIVVSPGIPTALGQLAAASSQPVTLSNENVQDMFVTGQSAQTAAVNNILTVSAGAAATDLTGYRSASVQLIAPAGTYTTGQVIFEGSNDNTNFQTIPVYSQLILTGTPITAAITLVSTTQLVYIFPVTTRYVRCRISTAITGASAQVQAFSKFSQVPFSPAVVQVAQSTGANLNAAISSLPTLANVTTVGTVTTCSTVTTLANGQTAHSSASTGSPVRAAGRVITTLDTTLVQGDASDLAMTTGQQLVTKDFASSENDWQFVGTVTTTTQTAIKAAGAANIRNFVTGITYQNTNSTATTLLVQDGNTTILSISCAATMLNPVNMVFPTPLRGTAATAVNYTAGTTAANVLLNVQGYQSF